VSLLSPLNKIEVVYIGPLIPPKTLCCIRMNAINMKKILLFLTIVLFLIPIESYSCECVHIASSFTKRIKQAEKIILGQIVKELSNGYLEINILRDYSNRINSGSILLFNGGGIDCLRNFSDDIGENMIFALNKHPNSSEKQIIYEVPNCIESALYLDEEFEVAEGNITRFNSFKSRVLYFINIHNFPTNSWRINRIEEKIKRKIR